jgi:dipeptidyl-peptidase 4
MGSRPHPHPHFLREFGETRGFTLGRPSRVRVTPAGDAVLFLRSGARETTHDLFEVDLASGSERLLLRASDLLQGQAEVITPAEQARRERQRITDSGFTELHLDSTGARILLPLSGRFFLHHRPSAHTRALPAPGGAPAETPGGAPSLVDGRFSPDGRRLAFLAGGDLFVLDLEDPLALPRAVTAGGDEDHFFGRAEFVAQEEMGRHEGYWWSPDGQRLAYAEVDQRAVERFAIADPARPEQPPQRFRYPRPGQANAEVRLWMSGPMPQGPAALAPGPLPGSVEVRWDRQRYPYLARTLWEAPGAPLSLLVQTRDQREAALLTVDQGSGQTRPLLVERDQAWVNLERDLPRWLPGGRGLLWGSDRGGKRILELYRPDGSLDRELVGPAEGFLQLAHIAGDGSRLQLVLGDAVTSRIESLDIASGHRQALTDGDGEHQAIFSADGATAVISRTAIDALPDVQVVRAGGGPARTLAARAAVPPFRARAQIVRLPGPSGCNSVLIRPADFVSGRRYPVVLHVYGGPHSLMVKADERAFLVDQWIADHGVVVVSLDNRGTPRRDREWERAIKGQLGDVPLADQVAGLTALGALYPELDLTRVGIYGWSFGGYLSALALLRRPDLFKVAVAGAPVVDWGDYDTHYTERYLDLPEQAAAAYQRASLLTYASSLSRPLLLVHGTADDNVYFFHSLKLAEALLRAGRPFDFLPLPRVTHQLGDPLLRERVWQRMVDFLLATLLPSPSPSPG